MRTYVMGHQRRKFKLFCDGWIDEIIYVEMNFLVKWIDFYYSKIMPSYTLSPDVGADIIQLKFNLFIC